MGRLAALLIVVFFCLGARNPILVPEISQHEIQVRQGFTGANLLLFGAILTPEGARAAGDYDIVVLLEGPARSIVVREKRKVAGIWVNAQSTEFRSAPSFYAMASSRPVATLVDAKTAAIYEMGLKWLQLSPVGVIDPVEQTRFSDGLVDLMRRQGLYQENEGAVKISGQVLYQARISLPSSVQTGTYTAETFAVRDGRVVASAISRVTVRKEGFERLVAYNAQANGFFYGLFAVIVSITMGWIAGRLFALV
jgi:uncharacterized protein (TIGR02186 family)